MADWNPETKLTVSGHRETERAIKGVGSALHGMGRSAALSNTSLRALNTGLGVMSTAMKVAATGAGILVGGIAGLGVNALRTAATFQTLRAQLDAVMGSSSAGKAAFDWIEKMEPKLPGNIEEITRLFTLMQTFKLDPTANLETVMDASLGDIGRAERMILALGQMKNNRVVLGEELNQLTEGAMIPAKDIMAQTFRLTEKELQNIGNVRLPANSAIKAILDWSKLNRGGASRRQMEGLNGVFSSLESAWKKLNRTVGEALGPMAIKAMESMTKWLNDPNTAKAVLKFTSYFVAGVEAAMKVGERFSRAMFDKDALRKWGYQFLAIMGKIAAMAIGIRTTLMGIELFVEAIKNIKNPIVALVQVMAALSVQAAGVAGMGLLNGKASELNARANKINAPGFGDMFKGLDIGARAKQLQAEWATSMGATAPGAIPPDPTNPNGPGGRHAGMSMMDQVILWGGGDRARATRTAMLGGYGRKAGIPEFRIKVDTTGGGKMDAAVAAIAEDVGSQLVAEIFRSPNAIQQMRSALGLV